MTPKGVHLVYVELGRKRKHDDTTDDDGNDKTITYWNVKDKEDEITIDQNDTHVMIKWIEGNDNRLKQSIFIPMERIFHILTGEPFGEGEEDISK